MPARPAPTPEIAGLGGLHLYHFGPSHSSQAVRQVLAEKDLPWTPHVVNLARWEHASDWFQALNPAGYVPVLVHNGEVWTESLDIMRHLDEAFPDPPLASHGDGRWLARVEQCHVPCRILSHQFLFGARRQLADDQLAKLAQLHRNPELIEFLAEFAHGPGFSLSRVRQAMRAMDALHAEADAALADTPWLAGARPGLADFAVATDVHRMTWLEYPLAEYPRVADWYARLSARAQFQRAVIDEEAAAFRALLAR